MFYLLVFYKPFIQTIKKLIKDSIQADMGVLNFYLKSFLKKYLNKVNIHLWDRDLMLPRMTYKEYVFFKKFLKEKAHCAYFESESGGSTLIAEKIMSSIYSYETAPGYVSYMNRIFKKELVRLIDIGAVKKFGFPEESNQEKANLISEAIPKHFPLKANQDALIFIDGRCRVLSALKLFPKLSSKDYLLIHDFEREEYQDILCFYEKLVLIDRLVVLKVKNDIQQMDLMEFQKKYLLDFR